MTCSEQWDYLKSNQGEKLKASVVVQRHRTHKLYSEGTNFRVKQPLNRPSLIKTIERESRPPCVLMVSEECNRLRQGSYRYVHRALGVTKTSRMEYRANKEWRQPL